MSHGDPCRNCGCCPHCGQRMPYAGPYVAPYPFPYTPPTIWPQVQPYSPWNPGDHYVGDPPPGMAPIITCTTSVSYAN